MAIRRGSQRRLGRPSAVIAGATVTDSTVSLISRRQAANRFAGSHSLSISSGPMTSLSPRSPSRARTACASSSAVVSFSKIPGSRAGPTSQARRAAGSCHRDPRWRVRSPRPPRGSAACARRVGARRPWPSTPGPRPARSPDAVGLDRRSSPARVRARVAAAVAAAVGVDHHPVALLAHADDHDISGLRHATPLDGTLTPFRRLGSERREGAGGQGPLPGSVRGAHRATERQGRRLRILQTLPSRRNRAGMDTGAGSRSNARMASALRRCAVLVRLVAHARTPARRRSAQTTTSRRMARAVDCHRSVRELGGGRADAFSGA